MRPQGLRQVAALLVLAGACGSGSNSEVTRDGGAGTTGAGGAAGAMGGGGSGGGCAPRTTYTEASHVVINVSWRAGTASMAGSGQVHLWAKIAFSANGNTLAGVMSVCGVALPMTTLSALAGGGMLSIEVPDAAWDATTMPSYPVMGTQTGWNAGSTASYSYAALVGFTLADGATAAWPSSYTGIAMTTDPDGDMNPGLTAVPRSGTGYTLPPTSILQTSRADRLYIVTRNVADAMVTRTACNEASGSATILHLDNHVVGCHVSSGSPCQASEINFIDQNRTIYDVTGATVTTKIVADGVTCADVRAALPM